MSCTAAEVKSSQGSAVVGPARDWTQIEELVQWHRSLENVATGEAESLFQVALADFLAPSGLTRQGDNLFAESDTSGSATIGTANSGGFGSLEGSTLELSNVDLAEEFVTMIQTQQAFQASARIINTTVDLLTETVNLVR